MLSSVRPRAIVGDAGRAPGPAGIGCAAPVSGKAVAVAAPATAADLRNPLRDSSIVVFSLARGPLRG
jgi:hypothetical protein